MIPKHFFEFILRPISQTKRHFRYFLPLGFLVFILGGCYTLEVVKAFDSKFPSEQSNKLITEYCQSCHIHKDFDPPPHVDIMRKSYKQKKFQEATECRTCHYVETQFMRNELIRKTKRPKDISRVEK